MPPSRSRSQPDPNAGTIQYFFSNGSKVRVPLFGVCCTLIWQGLSWLGQRNVYSPIVEAADNNTAWQIDDQFASSLKTTLILLSGYAYNMAGSAADPTGNGHIFKIRLNVWTDNDGNAYVLADELAQWKLDCSSWKHTWDLFRPQLDYYKECMDIIKDNARKLTTTQSSNVTVESRNLDDYRSQVLVRHGINYYIEKTNALVAKLEQCGSVYSSRPVTPELSPVTEPSTTHAASPGSKTSSGSSGSSQSAKAGPSSREKKRKEKVTTDAGQGKKAGKLLKKAKK